MLRRGEMGRYESMDWTTGSMDVWDRTSPEKAGSDGRDLMLVARPGPVLRALETPPVRSRSSLMRSWLSSDQSQFRTPFGPVFPKSAIKLTKVPFASALAHSRSFHAASLAIPADSHYYLASVFSVWPRSSHQRHPEHQFYHHHHFRPSPAPQNSLVDAIETPPLTHLLCIASLCSDLRRLFSPSTLLFRVNA
jgi:hypothetical protein